MATMTHPPPGVSLSARDVERWVTDNAALLGRRRINASVGRGLVRSGTEPVVWVSLTSEWASGRLIRGSDGSSDVEALSTGDGRSLLSQRHPNTTAEHLDELMAACSRPERPGPASSTAGPRQVVGST